MFNRVCARAFNCNVSRFQKMIRGSLNTRFFYAQFLIGCRAVWNLQTVGKSLPRSALQEATKFCDMWFTGLAPHMLRLQMKKIKMKKKLEY